MKRTLLILLSLLSVVSLSAQRRGSAGHRFDHQNNKHEVRIGYTVPSLYTWEGHDYYIIPSYSDSYFNSKIKYGDGETSTQTIWASYTYHTSKMVEFGARMGYAGLFRPVYSIFPKGEYGSAQKIGNYSLQYFSLMPTIKVTWLNKSWIRLYSEAAIGFALERVNRPESGTRSTSLYGNMQLTPFGIAVGKQFFCFGELPTIGGDGLMTLGLGYRF